MKDGGVVKPFCEYGKSHKKNCNYFAEGGEIDPSKVTIDAASDEIDPSKVRLDEEIPTDKVVVDDIPNDQVVPDTDGGVTEQIKAGFEGAAEGAIGPFAPLLETKLGISTKESINKRAKDFPVTHGVAEATTLAAGLLTGWGEAGLIAKGAQAAAEAANLGKIGSTVLRGAIEATAFQGADEISKGILGQGDPEAPVSAALLHMGAAGVLGGVGGGIFGAMGKSVETGLQKVQSQKTIDAAEKILVKIGESKEPLQDLGITDFVTKRTVEAGAAAAASYLPPKAWPVGYEAVKKILEPKIEKIVGKIANKANPYVTDAVIGCLITNETSALPQAIHYAVQVGKAVQKTNSAMDALFKAGAQQVLNSSVSDKKIKQIEDFVDSGGVDEQIKNETQAAPQEMMFAEGGVIPESKPGGFGVAFPDQNILLNQAKGRISGYLNSIRPMPSQNRLPFDKELPNKRAEKSYKNAIRIAAEPMDVLNKIQQGKLTAEDVKHFSQMMPEGYRYLSKEMTKRIMMAQAQGERPPYKKRISMSLFLGANLDSTLSPMAIQTIQSIYAAKRIMQQQPQQGPKKNKSNLSKSSSAYLTDDQAVARRQQSEKV